MSTWLKIAKLEEGFTKFVGLLFITFFGNSAKACFPLYGGGTCGGGGGTFCSPSYSAPVYSYPTAVDPSYSAYAPYGGGQYVQQPYHASKSRTMGSSYSASHNLDSCLRRFPDTRLACALPFERRTPSDERECQRHCLNAAPRCLSFQYDPLGSVCDLFEHTLASEAVYGTTTATLGDSVPSNSFNSGNGGDGWKGKKRMGKNAAIVEKQKQRRERRFVLRNGVPLDGHSKTMLTGMGHGGGGGMAAKADVGFRGTTSSLNNNCVPSLENRSGVLFIGIDPSCDISALAYDDEEDSLLDNNLPIPSPVTAPATVGQLVPMPVAPKLLPTRRTEMPFHHTTMPTSVAGRAEVEMFDCPDGARARIQLIDGISLTGQRVLVTIQLDSADVCLHVCRQNAHLDGLHFPSQCRSATFHRQSGRCEILGQAISPNGPLQYTPNPDSLYFEKICIPNGDLPFGCDDVIHRIPQHHLDPHRVAGSGTVQTATSQLECIRKCIQAKVHLGFECASASYFFDWPSQNCFLTRFTRLSRPDMYLAERKELVDYMEMPPCFQLADIRQHDSPAIGWSACIDGLRWRKKANCTANTVPNECTESEACTTETGIASMTTVTKAMAPNIEVAKRFRAPAVASNEASLFGEQDYEHQKEISFFGPPHDQKSRTKNAAIGAQMNEDGIDGGLENIDVDEGNENEIQPEPSPPSNCDPRLQCCPIEELDGPKGIVRGCSLGTRQLADGRKVSCVPDKCQ